MRKSLALQILSFTCEEKSVFKSYILNEKEPCIENSVFYMRRKISILNHKFLSEKEPCIANSVFYMRRKICILNHKFLSEKEP